ncbi:MAG: hypothetical protein K8T90_14735 [Planctomycetes bacterium]|nr:hypothetical protein [Planctomycetota bacterium]
MTSTVISTETGPRIGPRARSRLEFGAKAFLVVSFLGTLTAGVMRLQQKALADESHFVDLGAWSIVEKPSWATADDVRAIRDATRLRGWQTSLLDPAAGPVVWRSIDLAPTVVRVAGMKKCYPDEFEAVIEMRRPVAAVQIGGVAPAPKSSGKAGGKSAPTQAANSARTAIAWVEVDEDGIAVSPPLAARPVRDGSPLRVVTGVPGPAPAVGTRFGADVIEASDLLSELDRFGSDDEHAMLATIDEVDVSNFGCRKRAEASEIVLRAAARTSVGATGGTSQKPGRRCDVEWGRASPSDAYDPEPLFGAKASRLVQVLRMFPGLDGLSTVKVAFADLVVVPAQGSALAQSK